MTKGYYKGKARLCRELALEGRNKSEVGILLRLAARFEEAALRCDSEAPPAAPSLLGRSLRAKPQ